MANHKGKRGEPWTDDEVAQLRVFMPAVERRTMTQADIAERIGRSVSSVEGKIRTLRISDYMGVHPGPGLTRYDTPEPKLTDDRLHLEALHRANGYGFHWYTEDLWPRIYALETAPPKPRMFGALA